MLLATIPPPVRADKPDLSMQLRELIRDWRAAGKPDDLLDRWAALVDVRLEFPASLKTVGAAVEVQLPLPEAKLLSPSRRPASTQPMCRHCNAKHAVRPRGLCWTCYYTPLIRDQYQSTSKFGRRGVADTYGRSREASEPTRADPGTEAKVQVMIARAARREDLFHPQDAVFTPTPDRDGPRGHCRAPSRLLGPFRELGGCDDDRSDLLTPLAI